MRPFIPEWTNTQEEADAYLEDQWAAEDEEQDRRDDIRYER